NGKLMRGIDAVDIDARIGLGIAEALRLLEHLGEGPAALAHRRQDIVAGAVEDAVDAAHRIAGKAFAQGLDDRNAARDRRLEAERDAGLLGAGGELGAVMGEQRLVGGDHRPPPGERAFDHGQRRAVRAADQLDHRIDLGVARHRGGVVPPLIGADIDAAVARAVARRDGTDLDAPAGPRGDEVALTLQHIDETGADRAEPRERHRERRRPAHDARARRSDATGWPASRPAPLPWLRNCLMLRVAWRMRCTFSTRAMRTWPSPYSPNPTPGATATSAFSSSCLENSRLP